LRPRRNGKIHSLSPHRVFLKVLRKTRKGAGLTQVQLATKVGETQTFISKCERGEWRIDVIELRTICQAMGLTLKEFAAALDKAMGRQK